MAPEVLRGQYNEKCDVWSCGVIMYIFLSGSPPFNGNTNEEILDKILEGHVSFASPQWSKVSKGTIELIRKMLKYSTESRISASNALRDSWIDYYESKEESNTLGILEGIKNLQKFKVNSVIQKAVLSYIAVHSINLEEEKRLREIFTAIDKDKNGLLSLEELVKGYMILFKGDIKVAKEEAKKTMKKIDTNRNGAIDYNGN
jgi:calcium-dependent protein kinase